MKSGSLRQRENGRWQYRTSYGSGPDGKPRYRSATFGPAKPEAWSLRRAEREATKVKGAWDADHERVAAAKGTLAQLVDDWAAWRISHKQSPTTEYRNRSILNRIKADLGHIRLADLTTRHLDLWCMALIGTTNDTRKGARPITANTARHYLRVLASILEQGYVWDMVDRNVADKVTPPEHVEHDQLERRPTMAALEVMIGMANRSVRMAVQLAIATGLRRGELVALRWSDLQGSVLHCALTAYDVPGKPMGTKPPKSKAGDRYVVLNPSLLTALAGYRASGEAFATAAGVRFATDGPILAHLRKDPTGRTAFSPNWLDQEWGRLCDRAGVARFKLHGTRGLHLSTLHDLGASSAATKDRAGHSEISTTEKHYIKALPAAAVELAELTEQGFGHLFDAAPAPLRVNAKRA